MTCRESLESYFNAPKGRDQAQALATCHNLSRGYGLNLSDIYDAPARLAPASLHAAAKASGTPDSRQAMTAALAQLHEKHRERGRAFVVEARENAPPAPKLQFW